MADSIFSGIKMECEMCGKKTTKTNKVRVDHAILNVCDSCAKFGEPVSPSHGYDRVKYDDQNKITVTIPEKKPAFTRTTPRPKSRPPPRKRANIEELDIVPEYAELIREARSKLSWTQEDLAKKILERKNVLSNIERGELLPDIKTARKLEKALGIKLVESE